MSTSLTIHPMTWQKPIPVKLGERVQELMSDFFGKKNCLVQMYSRNGLSLDEPMDPDTPGYAGFSFLDTESGRFFEAMEFDCSWFEFEAWGACPLREEDAEDWPHDIAYHEALDLLDSGTSSENCSRASNIYYRFHFEGLKQPNSTCLFAVAVAVAESCDGLIASWDCGLPEELMGLTAAEFLQAPRVQCLGIMGNNLCPVRN